MLVFLGAFFDPNAIVAPGLCVSVFDDDLDVLLSIRLVGCIFDLLILVFTLKEP